MHRRDFLKCSSVVLGTAAAGSATTLAYGTQPEQRLEPGDWKSVRGQFALSPDLIHMSGFYLASHPRPVREAIDRFRKALDENPLWYKNEHTQENEARVFEAAGRYLSVSPADIALTDSTTMGLGLVYTSLVLKPGQEVLSSEHDHYSTNRSLDYLASRARTTVRRVRLYEPGGKASTAEIVSAISGAITPQTRVLALTWVHSSSGVKLPLRAIADSLAPVNAQRNPDDRVIFCVDGVHGLGVDDLSLPALGCDVFIAGTHKWLFGPRGTGLIWARPDVQSAIRPTIPPFPSFGGAGQRGAEQAQGWTWGVANTPGGFHSFEHRWALADAIEFHETIGKARVAERIHALNRQLKEGLSAIPSVTLHTPASDELSAGIVCFEVAGIRPGEVAGRLGRQGIVASTSPYAVPYARLAPGLLNDEQEVETCLRAVAAMA